MRGPGNARALPGRQSTDAPDAEAGRFEVYRADQVRMTAIHFAGGDWHWRLCDERGQVLIDTGGYRNEQSCREAVAILQERASLAGLWPAA